MHTSVATTTAQTLETVIALMNYQHVSKSKGSAGRRITSRCSAEEEIFGLFRGLKDQWPAKPNSQSLETKSPNP